MDNYTQGFTDALTAFAWWKDGVQYVGSCGMTLEKAMANLKSNPFYKPPKENNKQV